MAGKPYSIKELKVIVDYLVEQKAYSEIKGRKKWMDLANSQMTTRTWQSLKETFLKRILPDIHNPYYKLTMAQIRSFRESRDVATEQNNKLEIKRSSDISTNNVVTSENTEPSSTTNVDKANSEETSAGEPLKSLKLPPHNRCSVDTLILDQEDEEPNNENDNHGKTKSLRDCIIYTEPLTPMLQQVIDDFNSDDESEEGLLQIDENATNNRPEIDPTTKVGDKESNNVTEVKPQAVAKDCPSKEVTQNENEKEKTINNNEPAAITANKVMAKSDSDSILKSNGKEEKRSSLEVTGQSQTQNTNTSNDSALPNNQEILVQNIETQVNSFTDTQKSEVHNNVDTKCRKRSISTDKSKQNSTICTTSSPAQNLVNQNGQIEPTIQENPCLKSVSLFAEQFSQPDLMDSDSSDEHINDNVKEKMPKVTVDVPKEDTLLKSHSESESDPPPKIKKKVNKEQAIAKTRSKALARVFGFSTGADRVSKHQGLKKRSSYHQQLLEGPFTISDSEWTSESENDYVSPPRARRNKLIKKKYIKPRSARIMSLEEEGGLFVVHGRKIIPIVKDGKIVKNYTHYFEELDEDDEEESYWKLKYVQERKKTSELTKLLGNKTALVPQTSNKKQQRPNVKKPKLDVVNIESDESVKSVVVQDEESSNQPKKLALKQEKTIKIKFSGNDKEVQFEGHWSNIQPALEQVVNILQNDKEKSDKKIENKPVNDTPEATIKQTDNIKAQETSTSEVKRNVEELEDSIFKEIEEIEKAESEPNVTKRTKARPKRSAIEVINSPSKVPRTTEPSTSQLRVLPRRTKTPVRLSVEKEMKITRRESKPTAVETDDERVLYKFPSPPPSDRKTSAKWSLRRKSEKRYTEKQGKIFSSPDNVSLHSESTQGYQDSDVSPFAGRIRRKKKNSFSSLNNVPIKPKVKRFTRRRRSDPMLNIDTSSDSCNTSFNIPVNKTTVYKNSTVNSDDYKSESYQLLMPKTRPFKLLESIDETKPIEHSETNPQIHINSISCVGDGDKSESLSLKSFESMTISMHNDAANSSNVSLPISPELSIVEQLSINKSLLSSDVDIPTINEMQNTEPMVSINDQYMMSAVDASIPLMQQANGIQIHANNSATANCETPISKPVSDSLVNKICDVKLDDINSPPESLHQKLRQLILNSAKKIIEEMSIDTTEQIQAMEIDSSKVEPKKVRARKRCSTPQKKTGTQRKSNKPRKKNSVIEERVEFCTNGGRNSCPPSVLAALDVPSETVANATDIKETTKNKVDKRKKDVIKVKIVRPKSKAPKKRTPKHSQDSAESKSTIETSGGTLESGIFLQTLNDSIDLIHNHSETCLHGHDCIDSSVELLPAAKSTITIDSDSNNLGDFLYEDEFYEEMNFPDMYNSNAQDASCYRKISVSSKEPDSQTAKGDEVSVFRSPLMSSDMSIFTEDLSDETPTQQLPLSKWYLLSEDETTNKQPSRGGGLTANLNQIFPIICAVPDLSTITELSNNADSRKATETNGDNKKKLE